MEPRNIGNIDLSETPFKQLPISNIDYIVAPVVVVSISDLQIVGTAFNFGLPGRLITAKHVIDEALRLCASDDQAWIAVAYTAPGTDQAGASRVFTHLAHASLIKTHDDFDLAIILAEWINQGEVHASDYLMLDLSCPPAGERVLALGYTKTTVTRTENDESSVTYMLQQSLHASDGLITQIFPAGRDSVMLPFPSFETDVRMDAGMSGGPVVSSVTGGVCGVVCAALQEESADTYVSYASIAALLMGFEDPKSSTPVRLHEYVEQGQLPVVGNPQDFAIEIRTDGSWSALFPRR